MMEILPETIQVLNASSIVSEKFANEEVLERNRRYPSQENGLSELDISDDSGSLDGQPLDENGQDDNEQDEGGQDEDGQDDDGQFVYDSALGFTPEKFLGVTNQTSQTKRLIQRMNNID